MAVLPAVLIALSIFSHASEQKQGTGRGVIAGVVRDDEGAPVGGAVVTAVRHANGRPYETVVTFTSVSRRDGRFSLHDVAVGERYTVTIAKEGFGSFTQSDVIVGAETPKDIVATLTLDRASLLERARRLYEKHDYLGAARAYERAIAADPTLTSAFFFLGNSYDNLYRPARRGDPANDALLMKAIENYTQAAERDADPRMRKLAVEHLVAAFGPDKLDEPAKAVTFLQQLTAAEPTEPAHALKLAKLYEDAGEFDAAEEVLLAVRVRSPGDASVNQHLAGFYNRTGDFAKTLEVLAERAQMEPSNPQAHYTIATYYWDKAYRDFRLPEEEKRKYIEQGLEAVDRALDLQADYMEAMVYKNLLLRLMANVVKDPHRQMELLQEADRLRDRAQEIRKKGR